MRRRMPTRFRVVVGLVAVVALTVGLAGPSGAYRRPSSIERVSVAWDGGETSDPIGPLVGNPNDRTSLSRDARFVAFSSTAINLVPLDTNLISDVFVFDRIKSDTERVSVASDGSQALPNPIAGVPPRGSREAAISSTGRFVAFISPSINLVPGDTNNTDDVFLRDRKTGTTERLSVSSDGSESNDFSDELSLSANGQLIAFESKASNLVRGDTNNERDIFLHDRSSGRTTRVSLSDSGEQTNYAHCPSISADGRFVAFQMNDDSAALFVKVYVRDLEKESTELVSIASDGTDPSAPLPQAATCGGYHHAISADGRYVVFGSEALDLIPNDTNMRLDVFAHDRVTHRTQRLSISSDASQQGDAVSHGASISGSGRFVAFASFASNLVDEEDSGNARYGSTGGIDEGDWDAYLYDRVTGSQRWLSVSPDGNEAQGCSIGVGLTGEPSSNGTSLPPGIDASGRYISFYSCADNLIAEDSNSGWDVFVRDMGPELGIGGLADSGELAVPGSQTFDRTGFLAEFDLVTDLNGVLTDRGANLYGASLAYRPQYDDLFVRIQLEDMPYGHGTALAGDPAILYGLDLTANGVRYQVRAQRFASDSIAGLDPIQLSMGGASFGLFRCNDDTPLCNKVATLKGGYGTTGVEIVVALPLSSIGLESGGELSDLEAFTALGSYDGGAVKTLDTMTLPN